MSDAPEQVRLGKTISGHMCDFGDADGIEYIRADLVAGMVAHARISALEGAPITRIRQAVTEIFGKRCQKFEPNCLICQAWMAADAIHGWALGGGFADEAC